MSLFHLASISIVGFLSSLVSLSLQRKNFLSMLLCLEGMTLNLFILMFIMSNNISFNGHNCLILIALGACEATLGLAILVSAIRFKGNDYVSSLSSQKC